MIVAIADTHAIIWYLTNDKRLSKTAKNYIEATAQNGNEIGISGITLIEMVYLVEKGRIPPQHFSQLAQVMDDPDSLLSEIPINLAIAKCSRAFMLRRFQICLIVSSPRLVYS